MDSIKHRILVVEDDLIYAQLESHVLELAGFEVAIAGSVGEALGQIDGTFAAITLDLNLPDSFGPETLYRLRERHPEIPIVVISGCVTEHEFCNLISLGADACIQKPPDIEMVVIAVNRAIKMRDHVAALEVLRIYERSLAHA